MTVRSRISFWEYTKKSAQDATLEFFRPLIPSALIQEWRRAQSPQEAVPLRKEKFHAKARSIWEVFPSRIGDQDRENFEDSRRLIEAIDEASRDRSAVSDFPGRAATAIVGLSGEEEKVEPARQQEEFVKRGKQPLEILPTEMETSGKANLAPEELSDLVESARVQVEELPSHLQETPGERDSGGGQWGELFKHRKPPIGDRGPVVSKSKTQRA